MVKQSLCNALRLVVPMSVFLGSHRSAESADPQFTMRRKMEQLREELELVEQLRHVWQPVFTISPHVTAHGFKFLCFKTRVLLLLLITCMTPAVTLFLFSSEHREPTEADPPWGPGTVSDGRSCALPPRQSLSPPLRCGHPRSLACRGRSHSVGADDESLPHPAVCLFVFCIVRVPISFQPKLGMAKCRRNVENFLEACRKIGVPEVRPRLLVVFQCECLLGTGGLFLLSAFTSDIHHSERVGIWHVWGRQLEQLKQPFCVWLSC